MKIESCIHIARRQQRSGSFLGTLSKEKNAEFKTDPCAILTTASGFWGRTSLPGGNGRWTVRKPQQSCTSRRGIARPISSKLRYYVISKYNICNRERINLGCDLQSSWISSPAIVFSLAQFGCCRFVRWVYSRTSLRDIQNILFIQSTLCNVLLRRVCV